MPGVYALTSARGARLSGSVAEARPRRGCSLGARHRPTSGGPGSALGRKQRPHLGEGPGRLGVPGPIVELVRVPVVVVELDGFVRPLGVAPALAADALSELALAGGSDLAHGVRAGLDRSLRVLEEGHEARPLEPVDLRQPRLLPKRRVDVLELGDPPRGRAGAF